MKENKEFKLYFTDGSTAKIPYNDSTEAEILKQMKRPQEKRLYVYGIDFTAVKKAEVV